MLLTRRDLLGTVAIAAAAPVMARAQSTPAIKPAIKIGVLGDQSGVYRDLSGPVAAACVRQAVQDMAPHLNGIDVQVVVGDHQNKPDVGASLVRQWFDRDAVDMVTDCPNSAVALAVAAICHEKDKTYINSAAMITELTGAQCAPTTVHFAMDTYALARSTGTAMVADGGDTWFFVTADYDFGLALQRDTTGFITRAGGSVLGSVRAPFPTTDFSPYLLQAQSSGAKVIGLCNAGSDVVNSIKQAGEFGLTRAGVKVAGLLVFISDVHALGLQAAQGLNLTESFYWDLNDRTRAFTSRVLKQTDGVRPGMGQAGCYGGTVHYLKAVAALGAADARRSGRAVVARMKSMPTDDDAFGAGSIREDGRALHPVYLFQVKAPDESRGPWDYYKLVATTPIDQAWRPLNQGGCPMVHS
ncbi:ABC transporter substrate-binding protein [Acidisphaera sp. L21]|uniref:ABC transporter substrate-binding protein n=1 Tax=Acidisphaera sp. L21 TaxID=1641851 RepID=UPI00131EC5B1|nr:ABC transporter substrate-binding protein [Acidisphaera sp. L21]